MISSIVSLCYNQELLFNLCYDLDYSDSFIVEDQQVFDEIIGNKAHMYDSFKYATATVDNKNIDRRLNGYEID